MKILMKMKGNREDHRQEMEEQKRAAVRPMSWSPPVFSGIALVAVLVGFLMSDNRKIGVVRTADLMEAYKGMQEVQVSLEKNRESRRLELDTLQADYQSALDSLNTDWRRLNGKEREERSRLIAVREQDLIRYTKGLEIQVGVEENRELQKVMDRVNDVVRKYAEEKGYDVIYGATVEGSILHSEESLDITEELLEVLNAEYERTDNDDMASK